MAKKKKKKASRRVPAAVGSFMKRLNPSKMKGVRKVRIRKLKGGGISIIPERG